MASEFPPELVAKKSKQRLALRKEFLKELTNPHSEGRGHIFDPALQRFQSMRVTRIDHFRETPKVALRGFLYVVLPLAVAMYVIKSDRDRKEASYRRGEVAYKDRLFKFL